jgi:hypothetical protein
LHDINVKYDRSNASREKYLVIFEVKKEWELLQGGKRTTCFQLLYAVLLLVLAKKYQ